MREERGRDLFRSCEISKERTRFAGFQSFLSATRWKSLGSTSEDFEKDCSPFLELRLERLLSLVVYSKKRYCFDRTVGLKI